METKKTPEQIIAEEINQIITACKVIAKLSPHTVIPEEHCWNPKPSEVDPVYKNRLVNTRINLENALNIINNAYNITPLKDDHNLLMELGMVRSYLHNQILYYKMLCNESN